MVDGFTYGSQSTADFNMHAEKIPVLNGAKRRFTTFTVPGRNGSLHIDEGVYENYTQPYECYFHDPVKSSPELAHEIRAWLMSEGGYRKLIDAYDPTHYHMAFFAGPLDVDNRLNKYGKCVVNFDFNPKAYLISGEEAVAFDAAGTLANPTAFPAEPIIHVYGSGSGTVSVNGTTVTIREIEDVITLDCEMHNAYRQVGDGAAENKNNSISAPVFPHLSAGENGITFDGDITRVEIIPRWWEL